MNQDERIDRKTHAILIAFCLAFGVALSILLGPDILWDTRNYHLYNAWAFLHDRYAKDIAAAGMQSYFNPLPDLPYFLLGNGPLNHWPRLLAGLQGLWFSALVYVLFRIGARLAALQQRRFNLADICAVLIGATGTMAVSQAGSTTNELPLAVLVLIALYKLMALFRPAERSPDWHPSAWAGLCCGLAAGLKPTAMIYVPALALALTAAPLSLKQILRHLAIFAATASAGFLVGYGGWAWHLFHLTGNPVFPLFNQIFHSNWIASVSGTDDQFKPHNLAQWLFYPFFWLRPSRRIVTEALFADPRYALAMVSAAILSVACLVRRRSEQWNSPITRCLVIFFVCAYACWLVLFSILRYAIPMEALSGLLLLLTFRGFQPNWWGSTPRKALRNTVFIVLSIAVIAASRYPNWWRGRYGKQVFAVETGQIEPGSLVLLAGSPAAYVAPFFPGADDVDFIGLTWFLQDAKGFHLWDATTNRIASHHGPIYAVVRDGIEPDNALLHELLPDRHWIDCRPIQSNLEISRRGGTQLPELKLCRATPAQGESL
ncbi:hypothetical protein [Dyella mobilis]|uniref:Dolichyl-phosphate-mannose-protein mannosyltransferase n=1 Tax=Dyella mobilis TaxID=1849582 RepID=A0ABS2KBM6_9GAMM|nr:hypothetical protein [Dyella mobilis]MBM7128586.1 hypothetical protein [Dyella mobilis]GLQ99510.1 hypothetical protein GCM10007863_39300 [Dyella mobilis]